jgi:hypothetical protein
LLDVTVFLELCATAATSRVPVCRSDQRVTSPGPQSVSLFSLAMRLLSALLCAKPLESAARFRIERLRGSPRSHLLSHLTTISIGQPAADGNYSLGVRRWFKDIYVHNTVTLHAGLIFLLMKIGQAAGLQAIWTWGTKLA